MIEVEIQNETHQSHHRIRFAAVPRIGEGIRLREPDGCWASYDILDLWYQKAEYGDVWVPYLHVCMTPTEKANIAPARMQRTVLNQPPRRPLEGFGAVADRREAGDGLGPGHHLSVVGDEPVLASVGEQLLHDLAPARRAGARR